MTSARGRLVMLVCGMCFQVNGCRITNDTHNFTMREMTSWIDAFNNPPNVSYQLISPYLALQQVPQLRNLTTGPIFVNGFTYENENKAVVIQSADKACEFDVYCFDRKGGFEKPAGQYTYEEGEALCLNKSLPYSLNLENVTSLSNAYLNVDFWSEDVNVQQLFSKEGKINCMLLDLNGDGTLMLETDCNRNHTAVYVKGEYKQTIKKYSSLDFPFYKPDESGSTIKGTDATSSSPFSTEDNSYNPSTNHHDSIGTYSPGTNIPNTEQSTNKSKDRPDRVSTGPLSSPTTIRLQINRSTRITTLWTQRNVSTKINLQRERVIGGMNQDIFFTLVGVGSVVVVFGIIIICCCCRKRQNGTRGRPALSDDYSNPVDSIGVKDEDIESNPNNGVYASPQDSITLVKAKKRDSIGEGVYDVTSFTSAQRKPNVDPNIQCANAYAHVTIQPTGGVASSDDPENHYDSTSYMKPKPTVFVSSSHSDHTYGEVKIKTET